MNNLFDSIVRTVNSVTRTAEETVREQFGPHPQQRDRGRRGRYPGNRRSRANEQQQQQQPQQPGNMRTNARASARAVRHLPTIKVAPEDLVDPCNRECCICLEPNNLNDYVLRMPCAHIFHSDCLKQWLKNRCTCPICRFELETDDPNYEVGRLERMRHRKPRFAMYELKRLTVSELKAFANSKPQSRSIGVEKRDIIQYLIDKRIVELVPAPEPVQYQLSELKAMSISALRQAMQDAGVFFRREDVVEKSDMLILFQNSGRLEVLDEDDPMDGQSDKENDGGNVDDAYPYSYPYGNAMNNNDCDDGRRRDEQDQQPTQRDMTVETVYSVDEAGANFLNHETGANFTNYQYRSHATPITIRGLMRNQEPRSVRVRHAFDEADFARHDDIPSDVPRDIEVVEFDDDASEGDVSMCMTASVYTEVPSSASPMRDERINEYANHAIDDINENGNENSNDFRQSLDDAGVARMPVQTTEYSEHAPSRSAGVEAVLQPDTPRRSTTSSPSSSQSSPPSPPTAPPQRYNAYDDLPRTSVAAQMETQEAATVEEVHTIPVETSTNDTTTNNWLVAQSEHSQYESFSISDLSEIAKVYNVDISNCFERSDIIRLLIEARANPDLSRSSMGLDALDRWSVSQLRALANEVQIDLSNCTDREAMVDHIVCEVTHGAKSHVLPYLRTLAPLATMSLSELRGTARECQVKISDCIEKEEIIKRLIKTIKRTRGVRQ